eukprot:1156931-Pelagomonas_calceolata.AAC.5
MNPAAKKQGWAGIRGGGRRGGAKECVVHAHLDLLCVLGSKGAGSNSFAAAAAAAAAAVAAANLCSLVQCAWLGGLAEKTASCFQQCRVAAVNSVTAFFQPFCHMARQIVVADREQRQQCTEQL